MIISPLMPITVADLTRIKVVAGIIVDEAAGRILLAQRLKNDPHANKWEFPGGKLESNENAAQALSRELDEELGIQVHSSEYFTAFDYDYPHRCVHLEFRLVHSFAGYPVGRQGQQVAWIDIPQLTQIQMLEANQPVIERLIHFYA